MTHDPEHYFTQQQIDELRKEVAGLRLKSRELQTRFITLSLRDDRAREQAINGLARRVNTLARCIERVFEGLAPDFRGIPDEETRIGAVIDIQSFVMNAFGCCENLAWIWVLEQGIREADGKPLRPTHVGIGPNHQVIRKSFSSDFRGYLKSRDAWFEHLRRFRDALAHRIPLYIPPFVVRRSGVARYRELDSAISDALLQRKPDLATHLKAEQKELTRFLPIMAQSITDAQRPIVFHAQLLTDFNTVHEIAGEFLKELDRPRASDS